MGGDAVWRVDADGAAVIRGLVRLLLVCLPVAAYAHVGSKDVFEQVSAGPYKLFVTVRMPDVIPGVATVEARVSGADVASLEITPMPLTGEASKHPPAADVMKRSKDDPAFFTGGVWMMSPGAWQVRLEAMGPAGGGTAAVPVPAVAIRTLPMQRRLGLTLAALGLFLIVTMAGVVAAAVREARLPAGETAGPTLRRRGLLAMVGSLLAMGLVLWGGAKWWRVDAANYANEIYKPLSVHAKITDGRLTFKVRKYTSDNKFRARANDDFLPDHGKLIHLYAIRQPEMDAVFHLHPTFDGHGEFTMDLPKMPPGDYRLYGDIVHANGFPETLTTTVVVPPAMQGVALSADDVKVIPAPVSQAEPNTIYTLPDGYRMVWTRPPVLTADTAYAFHFSLLAPNGQPATGMQPYLGMAGHAAFVKTDGAVFAHTHPEGSAAMASLMLANGTDRPMQGMADGGPLSNAVDFPYGFPSPGKYRIFIQMKHAGQVETGVFDTAVSPK